MALCVVELLELLKTLIIRRVTDNVDYVTFAKCIAHTVNSHISSRFNVH